MHEMCAGGQRGQGVPCLPVQVCNMFICAVFVGDAREGLNARPYKIPRDATVTKILNTVVKLGVVLVKGASQVGVGCEQGHGEVQQIWAWRGASRSGHGEVKADLGMMRCKQIWRLQTSCMFALQ